ncbi:MAG: class I SAM-dependent methyltransferase [Acidobacteria bacterium]|nr:class I SAM-dependent methyltransferase [Acidobacteriota bacterium]
MDCGGNEDMTGDLARIRDEERAVRDAYDSVPYPSASQHHTHPDHLAALAILNGLDPAPAQRCRVLELGCADGGNLIPMAAEFPESRFTGIDLSPKQIESGRAAVAEAGLANLDLRVMSILDVDTTRRSAVGGRESENNRDDAALRPPTPDSPLPNQFDYILCHGVFSWVTPEVQEAIFEICRTHLAPHGVAYISYNTYPGWHLREMVRDMVVFHTRHFPDGDERTARAFEFVQFLSETSAGGGDAHALMLRTAREHFEEFRHRPAYLAHEYLERTNAPIYFHEFAERAAGHGLQYVSEAEPAAMEADNLAPNIAARLHQFTSDRIELEQYVDFAANRMFRRTLLCHANARLDRDVTPKKLRRLYVSSRAKPVSDTLQPRGTGSESFRTERGAVFSSAHPLAKAALSALFAAWPEAIAFDTLRSNIARLLDEAPPDDDALTDLLASLHAAGVITLHASPPNCARGVSAFPRVSALARLQAAAGLLVTNQHHRVVRLDDPFVRFMVRHLNGTRSHADLVRLLDAEVTAGRLDVSSDGQPIREPQRIPAVLQALVAHHLRQMTEYALLVE